MVLSTLLQKPTHLDPSQQVNSSICPLCLGVLQFCYRDEKDILVEKDHAHDFAILLSQTVKHKSHEISSFTLELSLPTLITENEQLIL